MEVIFFAEYEFWYSVRFFDWKRLSLLIVLCGGLSFAVEGQEWLQRGDQYYNLRAQGAHGDRADRVLAVNAVNSYRLAMNDPTVELQAAVRLLRALYFQGCFAYNDSQDRLNAFTEAKEIGERMVAKYPGDADLAYWWSVNLSLWAKESGPIAAVRSGVADKIRNATESALSRGPSQHVESSNPAMAGVYQVLGRMHHLLPRIPFLLPWPSKDLAEKYLRKAVALDPDNLANHLFLAEFYRDQDRPSAARRVLASVLHREPRPGQELEDRRNLWKMHNLEVALRASQEPDRVAMLSEPQPR